MTGEYIIGDGRELPEYVDNVAAAAIDLAWARPKRNGEFVTYETHSPDSGLWEFVDAVYDALATGGWAFFDADSWLLPRLIGYLQEEWGDVAATYSGGGYRRTGWVKQPAGNGHYFTNGGYPVVFAHKGETDRESSVPASVEASVPHDVKQELSWGTPKPIDPYQRWLESVVRDGETVAIPCAGTAPAAIGLENSDHVDADWVAIDSKQEAKAEFQTRRQLQLTEQQTRLSEL